MRFVCLALVATAVMAQDGPYKVLKTAKTRLHPGSHAADMRNEIHFLVDPECLQRDGGGDRVSAVSEAVTEHADLLGLFDQRIVDRFADHDGADGQIAGR